MLDKRACLFLLACSVHINDARRARSFVGAGRRLAAVRLASSLQLHSLTRLRANAPMMEAARSADEMSKLWKVVKQDSILSLVPPSVEWATKEIDVEITRTVEAPGIGIALTEYGEGEDGTGLTLVEGLVEDGNAARVGADILPGDVIVAAGSTITECLNYARTIDALVGLPPAPLPARIRVKRLVKRPGVTCNVIFPQEEDRPDKKIKLYPGRTFRQMLLLNGVQLGDCNDDLRCLGGCGMLVRKGLNLLEEPQTQERQMLKEEPYWRLTCRACIAELEKDEEMTIRIRPDPEKFRARGAGGDFPFR